MDFPFHRFSNSSKNILYPQTLNTLQALDLRVEGSRLNSKRNATVFDILYFLNQFTSLSHLRLVDVSLLILLRPSNIPPPPPSFQLYEFGWLDHTSWGSMDFDFSPIAEWLFGGFKKGPAVFQLDDSDNVCIANMFSYFISRHGQNLVSLSSSISPRQMARLSVNLAEACPHLQKLILPDRTILSENFIHPNIPLKITHLGLGGVLINDMANVEQVH